MFVVYRLDSFLQLTTKEVSPMVTAAPNHTTTPLLNHHIDPPHRLFNTTPNQSISITHHSSHCHRRTRVFLVILKWVRTRDIAEVRVDHDPASPSIVTHPRRVGIKTKSEYCTKFLFFLISPAHTSCESDSKFDIANLRQLICFSYMLFNFNARVHYDCELEVIFIEVCDLIFIIVTLVY